MASSDDVAEMENRILYLETKVRHLTNDLRVTRDEHETASASYLEIYSNMEKIIHERTKESIQTAKELRKSEEKYRNILESMEEGYYEVDLRGNLTFFNDAMCRITGYSREELRGINTREFMTEKTGKKVFKAFEAVYTTGKSDKSLEWEGIKKDGTKGYVESSVSLIKDSAGKPIGFRGVVRDVTKRKMVERELVRTKDFLQNIFDGSIDGITSTDLEGNVLYASSSAKDILGYETDELVGEKVYATYENGVDDARKIMKALKEKGELREYEIRFKRTDGELIDVNLSASYLRNDKGEVIGTIGIYRDITEKKRLEALFKRIQNMEAISTLAGGIAHVFNNTLMGITGNMELLKMDLPKEAIRDDYFVKMKGAAHRMSRLTDQLLAYAEGGKYRPTELALGDFVRDTLPILEHTLSPEITVETDLPRDIAYTTADSTQMQMVLSAILANAKDAIQDEVGRIRITVGNDVLDETFTERCPGLEAGPYVCLTVEDDGRGMNEEARNRIFDPFFTTKFEGRGMGMAAVYGIVRNHDGWITVESELNKGTAVRIWLPAIEVEPKAAREEEPEPFACTGTILVIEDEENVMEIARAFLERLGYRVLEAGTGNKAVEIAETFSGRIDLALLDIKLPDIPGDKVYSLIMKARPNLKVVVSSGYSIDGPARKILDAGAQDFIQKPFSLSTLSEKLKVALEKTNP
jgi:two-component system, cell cycle sensor histidine kinase and response regulator CckA